MGKWGVCVRRATTLSPRGQAEDDGQEEEEADTGIAETIDIECDRPVIPPFFHSESPKPPEHAAGLSGNLPWRGAGEGRGVLMHIAGRMDLASRPPHDTPLLKIA